MALSAATAGPAYAADPATTAVNWAQARVGQHIYDGQCLAFVHDAYSSAGVNIGSATTAVVYWNGHSSAHMTGANPPAGALVFWGATPYGRITYVNPDGHVALSIGGGNVVSSYERSNRNIHVFAISDRNAAGYPYLGWMMPPGVTVPSGATGGGNSTSSNNVPLLGDATGNGKADAVLINPNNGDVWVALSTGSNFASPQLWSANGVMAHRIKYFLADTNGDHRADLVAFDASGNWYVALSSGSGFWPPTLWAANEGGNSTNQFVADVNGDDKADVVLFWNSVPGMPQGTWATDLSSGSGFYGPPNQWINGAGVGSSAQVVGDFNGDGKTDVAMYYASSGVWNVSLSAGTSFGYPGSWSYGHGMGSTNQFAGDINGDREADISYFWSSGSICGTWEAGISSSSGFWTPTYWATNEDCGSTVQFIADVSGSGKGAVVAYWENVSGQPSGMWTVDTSSGSGFYGPPNQWITNFGDNKG